MPQSDPGSVSGPRRLPKAEDFPATGPYSLAAPGPRFGARAIDLAVVAVPALVVLLVTAETIDGQYQIDVPLWLMPAAISLGVLYEFAGVAWRAKTPGKWLLGLRVARYTDGKPPTAAQALLRAIVPWSVLALPLGPFAIAAFLLIYGSGVGGELHRGVPDQAAGTLVISTR
ncbi:MAG TPA: RDD family protein [Acidimicrobiales bacterium]